MQFVLDSFAFQINRAGWRDVRAIWELERAAFDRDAYGLLTLLAMSFAPRASWLKAVADGRWWASWPASAAIATAMPGSSC